MLFRVLGISGSVLVMYFSGRVIKEPALVVSSSIDDSLIAPDSTRDIAVASHTHHVLDYAPHEYVPRLCGQRAGFRLL